MVVADLPFGSYQASPQQALTTATRFMKEGIAHAVKLEGGKPMVPEVELLVRAGIPVMGHIGFTPQSEHVLGGYKVQGRGAGADKLMEDALALEDAGCFAIVMEMVPAPGRGPGHRGAAHPDDRHRGRPALRRPGARVAGHGRAARWPRAAVRQEVRRPAQRRSGRRAARMPRRSPRAPSRRPSTPSRPETTGPRETSNHHVAHGHPQRTVADPLVGPAERPGGGRSATAGASSTSRPPARTCTGRRASSAKLVPPPSRVLDAGCGFGRVASKLTRLGHTAIGVDVDEDLIALAREDSQTRFFVADLSTLDLRTEQEFACVVMAGNVVPYLADGTLPRVLDRLAATSRPGGYLVSGFGLGGSVPTKAAAVDLRVYDRLAEAAGLSFIARHATWDEQPFVPGGDYAVSVHRRLGA